jgi:uncharacterized protein GlcG (DUF336 family)
MNRRVQLLALLVPLAALKAHSAELSLSVAVEAATAAVEACKANGYHVTVTILDPDLSTRVVLRDSDAPAATVQIAYRKAYTVLKMGMTSGEFGKSVPPPPPRAPGAPPGPVNGDANLITYAGGIPIKANNMVIGALSVSGAPGGEKDEVCANTGLAKVASKIG